MIKSFVWTLIFWTLFVLFNTVGDAILFYSAFPWYKNMDLWHFLKYFWIGFGALTGFFARSIFDEIWSYNYSMYHKNYTNRSHWQKAGITVFFLAWFFAVRYGLHEALMWKWRQP